MKILAGILSLLLCAPAFSRQSSDDARQQEQNAPQETAHAGVPALIARPTWEVQPPAGEAQSPDEELTNELETIRAAGGATAGTGLGLIIFGVFFDVAAGPVGWGATLLFFGGMSSYLAHRRLNGNHDFSMPPSPPKPAAPAKPESPQPQPAPAPQPQSAPGV